MEHLACLLVVMMQLLLATQGHHVTGRCPAGWSGVTKTTVRRQMRYGNVCYKLVTSPKRNWFGALKECVRLGGNLARIFSAEENDQVIQLLKNECQDKNSIALWIGLHDLVREGNWQWIGRHLPAQVHGYTNWDLGQPKCSGGSQKCGEIRTRIGPNLLKARWHDYGCEHKQAFICELELPYLRQKHHV